jgi:hypothetical protein
VDITSAHSLLLLCWRAFLILLLLMGGVVPNRKAKRSSISCKARSTISERPEAASDAKAVLQSILMSTYSAHQTAMEVKLMHTLIDEQMQILNTGFAQTPFKFRLIEANYEEDDFYLLELLH